MRKLVILYPDSESMDIHKRHETNHTLNLIYLYDKIGVEETEKQLKELSDKK